ncbi:RstC protein [Vibrio cholerae]|uniref:RstC protein n=2 Tax=Vibrio cholerae TaxID=666 RepID=UPI0004D72D52|nr:RstC protein [Vibrio cholerae]ELA4926566.1 RstC protein [Vibrio cholerae]KEH03339.1 RstC protein [Vibrio cholerae 2012EL-1759]KEH04026.1 RstC protein [Vibrio cholerae 2012EL-1759]NOF62660.1 RstC protein [Vibrio cholerae]OFJ31965.1 RstC protein [Vibrio cholerae]
MSLKPYTLMDVYDSLEDLNNMALYLKSGAYTDEIAHQVQNLICDKIIDLQGMVNFMRLSPSLNPQLKALTEPSL